MQKLTQLIEELGIYLDSASLPSHLKGFYFQDTYHDMIIINSSVKNENEFREVLSHELGHYFTSILTNPASSYSDYLDILNGQRNEFRAIRWACNYLAPDEQIIMYIKKGLHDIESLCDAFDVSRELLIMKLYIMSLDKLSWHIDGNKYLVLSSLPSIYIFERF